MLKSDRIRFDSLFGHNRTVDICTKQTIIKRRHRILTWKTHYGGKNHDSPQTAEYTMMRRLQRWEHKGNDLLHPLSSPHAAVTTRRQLPLSLSLSLSHALYNCTLQNINNLLYKSVCPKSYLYIYDFRTIYTNVHTNRSDRSEPVLGLAGSLYLPSGGTSFPTILRLMMLYYVNRV